MRSGETNREASSSGPDDSPCSDIGAARLLRGCSLRTGKALPVSSKPATVTLPVDIRISGSVKPRGCWNTTIIYLFRRARSNLRIQRLTFRNLEDLLKDLPIQELSQEQHVGKALKNAQLRASGFGTEIALSPDREDNLPPDRCAVNAPPGYPPPVSLGFSGGLTAIWQSRLRAALP
jgi:hypothetical protein